jgi:predicted N-acetyltransferase YhbS
VKLRKLTIGDYEAITSLWTKAKLTFKPRGRDSREAMAAEMAANPDFFVGAFEDNNLIGVVVLSCDLRKGWANRLAVDPECRRRGVACALVAEAEKILRRRGVKLFCALIEEGNVVSKQLFKHCGYSEDRSIAYFSKRDNEDI